MLIRQGDIYWAPLDKPNESQSEYIHPHVVIRENVINHIQSVVVCALTTNIKWANLPGNVLLEVGEANLPKQSIVVVSQISTMEKAQLGEYIGSLSTRRMDQIQAGMRFVERLIEHRGSNGSA